MVADLGDGLAPARDVDRGDGLEIAELPLMTPVTDCARLIQVRVIMVNSLLSA